MEGLSLQIIKLLDKLYNLRGKDSVVLSSLEEEKNNAKVIKETNEKLIGELQEKINTINSEESILTYEGEKLRMAISQINKTEFDAVLKKLNIDFDPESIHHKISESLPRTLEDLSTEKIKTTEELKVAEERMNDSITKISELAIRTEEAMTNQESLNKCFEMAFNSSISGTREEITSLLAKFDFSLEEQREGAKLLMFPEDSLFVYDRMRKNGQLNVMETKPVTQPVEPVYTNPVINTEPVVSTQPETILEVEIHNTPTVKEVNKETLMNLLSSLGYDYLDFTANDFDKMINNYDELIIAKNTKVATEKGISKDIFLDNIELIYDPEFEAKCDILLNTGKEAKDIYLNPSVLIKYSLADLNRAINLLKDSGLDPKNVPLMAY